MTAQDPIAHPPTTPELGTSGRNSSRLAWGIALIVFGLMLLAHRLELTPVDRLMRYSPLVLVGIGLFELVRARSAGRLRSALWLLFMGGWLLASLLHLFDLSFRNSWPLLILFAGIMDVALPKRSESRWGGLWPLAIGAWLCLNTWELGGLEWANSWPLLLVFAGLMMLAKGLGWTAKGKEGSR